MSFVEKQLACFASSATACTANHVTLFATNILREKVTNKSHWRTVKKTNHYLKKVSTTYVGMTPKSRQRVAVRQAKARRKRLLRSEEDDGPPDKRRHIERMSSHVSQYDIDILLKGVGGVVILL